ncbi:hypothetical protein IBX73_06520 [candidate division WOR-3 bacterium]|nr:hypothetical protein [candidate division WOR-3 bacterium]
MSGIEIIGRKASTYARSQNAVDLVSMFILVWAAVIVAFSVALFMLKSPWYGLIGIVPLFFFRPAGFLRRAHDLEKKAGLKGEIVSSIQLSRIPGDNKERYSRELIEAFIDDAAIKVAGIEVAEHVSRDGLARAARYFLIAVCLFLIHPAFFPARFWYALNHRIECRVDPGSAEYPKGAKVEIALRLWGVYLPRTVTIEHRAQGKAEYQTLAVEDGLAAVNLTVSEPMTYCFSFFKHKTRYFDLSPVEPLRIEQLTFRLRFPAYSRRAEETTSGRQLIVPAKTVVQVEGRASAALKQAWLEFGDTVALAHQGREFRGEFTVRESGTAILHLVARRSLQEPIRVYSIPDFAPLVDIFYPGIDVNLPHDMRIDIGVRCSDDHGLAAGYFYYTLDEGFRTTLALKPGAFEDTVIFEWDLSALGMLPGDEVSYFVTVSDNSGQVTRSTSFIVRFPSMEQIYDEVAEKRSLLQSGIDEVIGEHETQMKETARIREKMMKERDLAWADQEQLREVIRSEEGVVQKIEEWRAELEQTIEKLKEGVILDPQSIERMKEIARILEEIAPEELREALEALRSAMEQRPTDMSKALEQLQQRQEELARALERSLEILKRYEQEEKLRQLAAEVQEVAEQQELIEELSGLDDELALEKQQEVDQRMAELARRLDELAGSEGLEDEISEALEQMAMEMAELRSAAGGEKKKGLMKMAMALQQLFEKLTKGRFADVRGDLLASLKQVIETSKAQEQLANQGTPLDPRAQQEIIQATETIAESLFQLQSKSFFAGPHIGKGLARAVRRMTEAQQSAVQDKISRVKANEAMKELNLVARDILFALKMMAEDGSSTGMNSFMQQLANITQGQMMLSQSLMNILPIPMPGMSAAQQAQVRRLAQRQRALREALESLRGEAAAGKYQDMLDNMVGEMRNIEQDLFQYKVDRELIERQKKVISRLLDSQRSIRREDYAQKRESKPGQDVLERTSPASLSRDLGRDELRELLQEELRKPYPKEYELYIREYFKSLLEEK